MSSAVVTDERSRIVVSAKRASCAVCRCKEASESVTVRATERMKARR